MDENFSLIKKSIQEQSIPVKGFNAGYADASNRVFLADMNKLVAEAEKNANQPSDRGNPAMEAVNKSYVELTKKLSQQFSDQLVGINFRADNTVEDRKTSLDTSYRVIDQIKQDYRIWAESQPVMDNLPGKDIEKLVDNYSELIRNDMTSLDEYENNARWDLTRSAYRRKYNEKVTGTKLTEAVKATDSFAKKTALLVLNCTPFKEVPDSTITAMNNLAEAARKYKTALGDVTTSISTENDAKGKFIKFGKATAAGRNVEKQIYKVLECELPANFRKTVLEFANGVNTNNGMLATLDDLVTDGNNLIELLGYTAKPEAGINSIIEEPNPKNRKDISVRGKVDVIEQIPNLKYVQNDPNREDQLDHDHFVELINTINGIHDELQKAPGYKKTLDPYEGRDDFLSAFAMYEQSNNDRLSALDVNNMGKGNEYAAKVNNRLEQLANINALAYEYMAAIAQTTYDLNKADPDANKQRCTELNNIGRKLQQFRSAIADDVKLLDSMQLKNNIERAEIDNAEKKVGYPSLFKGVYDNNRKLEKNAAERDIKLQEEEERLRKLEEEFLKQDEEQENETRELEKKKAEAKAEKERLEKQRLQEEKAKEEREEKERNEREEQRIKEENAKKQAAADKYSKYYDIINSESLNFEPRSLIYVKEPLGAELKSVINTLKADGFLEKDSRLAKEIIEALNKIGGITNMRDYNKSLENTSDLYDIKDSLETRSSELERVLGLNEVLKKLKDYRKEIKSHGADSRQELYEKCIEIDDIGIKLTEYYHKAAEDGRTLFEKTKAVEEPGIGNGEAFLNEDHSIDKLFVNQIEVYPDNTEEMYDPDIDDTINDPDLEELSPSKLDANNIKAVNEPGTGDIFDDRGFAELFPSESDANDTESEEEPENVETIKRPSIDEINKVLNKEYKDGYIAYNDSGDSLEDNNRDESLEDDKSEISPEDNKPHESFEDRLKKNPKLAKLAKFLQTHTIDEYYEAYNKNNEAFLEGKNIDETFNSQKEIDNNTYEANDNRGENPNNQPEGKEAEGIADIEAPNIPEQSDGSVIDTSLHNVDENFSNDIKPEMSPAQIARQREKLLKCSKLLDDSRTFVNSKEYMNLIELTKKIGKGETKTTAGLSPQESFAEELYALHVATEKYLNHKAVDGVKKNVFRKLAAVQKTNDVLEGCLDMLGNTELKVNNGKDNMPRWTSDLPVSLEARQNLVREKLGGNVYLHRPKDSYQSETDTFMRNNPNLPQNSRNLVEAGIRSADTCMCEIIMKAQLNHDPTAVNGLHAMRETLLRDPFPPVKEETQPSMQQNRNTKRVNVK